MDIKRFQAIEKQLAEQAEATRITNKNLARLFWMMSTTEAKKWCHQIKQGLGQ
jgi:hypothetical protein